MKFEKEAYAMNLKMDMQNAYHKQLIKDKYTMIKGNRISIDSINSERVINYDLHAITC